MAYVQPVQTVNYGNLLLQGLQAYQGVKQIQRQGAQDTQTAEIRDLSVKAQTDPEALRMLMALDPQRATAIQHGQATTDTRFRQERAFIAGQIEGLPMEQQIPILQKQVERVSQRGGDPSNTQGLLDLLQSGDPNKMQQGQSAIMSARVQGEREGFLKPQGSGGRPLSEKSQFVVDKFGVKYATPEFREKMVETYPTEKNKGMTEAEKKTADVELKIKRNTLIKGYKNIGFNPAQISNLLTVSKDAGEEVGTLAAEYKLIEKTAPELLPEKRFDMEQKLRKEYANLNKGYLSMAESIRGIRTNDPNVNDGPADISLITGFMKMIDEGSTVREAEFAVALKAGGLMSTLRAMIPKIEQGAFLDSKTRIKFQKQAEILFKERKIQHGSTKKTFSKISKDYGLKDENIFFIATDKPLAETGKEIATPLTADELSQFQ